MSDTALPFFARISLAFAAFFRVLFDGSFAAQLARLESGEPPAPAPKAEPPPEPKTSLRDPGADGALSLLGLMQREGRLIDFLQEDVGAYPDADIGAAARVVHDSLKKALGEHVRLSRVHSGAEGQAVTVPKGFSPGEIRVVGNVVGEAPFQGTLNHAGWRVTEINLPQVSESHDLHILAPAEVEL